MWMKDEGFAMVSIQEPLSFVKRRGTVRSINSDRDWFGIHTEESVLELKAMGVSLIRVHFFKGLGLEAEKEERALAKEFILWCHKHGIRVQVYVQFGSMMAETYRSEEPDFEEWYSRDEQGNPIMYCYKHQPYRYRPCLTKPGYWEYLKKALKEAVVDCKVDAIGFDNVSGEMEPEVCHCDACKKAFVEFLIKRFPDVASARERFGHSSVENIRPPVWSFYSSHFSLTEITDPVIQEWIEFRTFIKARRVEEMYKLIKSYNPDCLVEVNAFKQTGQNTAFHYGLYVDDCVDGCDGIVGESEPNEAGYKDGVLLNKARLYKKARALGKAVITPNGWNGSPETVNNYLLGLSEGMALNYGTLNVVKVLQRAYRLADNEYMPHKPLLEFAKANRELYLAELVPSVHLYESRASLAYSNFESHYANILMHQVLLREKIPYAVLNNLDCLENVKVVILPGTMCMSEEEIDKIVSFVKSGGGLIITGESGDYNEWYWRLEDQSLRSKLNVRKRGALCAAYVDKGRVAVFPRLSSRNDFNTYDWTYNVFGLNQMWVGHSSWEAPSNIRQVADAVRWALNYDLPFVIGGAPDSVVCEFTRSGDVMNLHLLNYDVDNPVKALTVTYKDKIKTAELIIPLSGDKKMLEVSAENSVIVDELKMYAIIRGVLRA